MISEWLTDPGMLVVRQPLPPPLTAHLTCLGWCRLCHQGARGWRLLGTGVSGLWSTTPAGGSGMISEWLTDPGMLVVHQPLPPPTDGTPHVPGMVPPLPPVC